MRIGFDASPFHSVHGTEVFTAQILTTYLRQYPFDAVVLFAQAPMRSFLTDQIKSSERLTVIVMPSSHVVATVFYQQLVIPVLAWWYRLDILYSPSPFFAWLAPVRKVVTIHDAAYKRFGMYRTMLSGWYIRLNIFFARLLARTIVTVSAFSKQELMTQYRISAAQIVVISEGLPQLVAGSEQYGVTVLNQYRLQSKQYLVYIGIGHTRKNLARLVEAFALFVKTHTLYQLVLAGNLGATTRTLTTLARSLGVAERVVCTGPVTAEHKRALLDHAFLLVYPSLYEGFGLPVLEAQSIGLPVLTSTIGVLPDTAGVGAHLVDPFDVNAIAQGIAYIAEHPQYGEQLIARGYENIQRFSWNRTADVLHSVFEQRL